MTQSPTYWSVDGNPASKMQVSFYIDKALIVLAIFKLKKEYRQRITDAMVDAKIRNILFLYGMQGFQDLLEQASPIGLKESEKIAIDLFPKYFVNE